MTLRGLELVYRARPEAAPVTVDVGQLRGPPRSGDPQGRGRGQRGGGIGRRGSSPAGSAPSTTWPRRARSTTSSPAGSATRRSRSAGGPATASLPASRTSRWPRQAPTSPRRSSASSPLAARRQLPGERPLHTGRGRRRGRPRGHHQRDFRCGARGGRRTRHPRPVRSRPRGHDAARRRSGGGIASRASRRGRPRSPGGSAARRGGSRSRTPRSGSAAPRSSSPARSSRPPSAQDLFVRATGGDLAELSSITRLRLPPGPFEVAGRFRREEGGLGIDDAELHTGGARVRASGALGEPARALGLDLTVDATGPDSGPLARLAGIALPPGPFALSGRVARDGPGLALDAVEARIDDHGCGRLEPVRGLVGTDLELRVGGSDLAGFLSVWGLDGLPAVAFDAGGRLRIAASGYELAGVEGTVGRLAVALDGRLAAPSLRDGTTLSGRINGPALADLAAWGLPATLPAEPFSVAGTGPARSRRARGRRPRRAAGLRSSPLRRGPGHPSEALGARRRRDSRGRTLALGRFLAGAEPRRPRGCPPTTTRSPPASGGCRRASSCAAHTPGSGARRGACDRHPRLRRGRARLRPAVRSRPDRTPRCSRGSPA